MQKNPFIQKTLSNGVRTIHVPLPKNPAVTAMVIVGVGSNDEKEKENGIAHFLEHMMFKGTLRRPTGFDLTRELDEIGARYNAFTSHEYTAFYVKAARPHAARVIDILADMTMNGKVREEEVERERGVILEEIHMYHDQPQDEVWNVFREKLFGDAPAGRDILGDEKTVGTVTARDLARFRKKFYGAENIVVATAGDVKNSSEIVSREFGENAGNISQEKPRARKKVRFIPLKKSESSVAIQTRKTDQTHFVLGAPAPDHDSDERFAMGMLAGILDGGMSSRIFQAIREKLGAAYYANFGFSQSSDHGYSFFNAGTGHARVEEVIKAFLSEVRDIQEGNITSEEFNRTRDAAIGSLFLSLETSNAQARFYGFQELFRDDPILTPEMIKEKIKAVTKEEVVEVARKYLNPKDMRLALIGPAKSAKKYEKLFSGAKS